MRAISPCSKIRGEGFCKNMKLLLAGPGTGKTTKIKEIINSKSEKDRVLVISFTNATVQDLLADFRKDEINIEEKDCSTLHKYALRINHQKKLHILNEFEKKILEFYAKKFNSNFDDLCRTLGCITFDQMIIQTSEYIKSNPLYLNEIIDDIDLFIVDEYQDFNLIERNLIDLIAQKAKDVFVLGDDDQCIYDFKDANSDGIIELYNSKNVENVSHDHICYRCPDKIVSACFNLINKNQKRIKKEWRPSEKEGDLIFNQILTQQETSEYILNEINKIKQDDPTSSIMILSSVRFAVEDLLNFFDDNKMDYVDFWKPKMDLEKLKRIWEIKIVFGEKKLLNLLFLIQLSIKGKNSHIKKCQKIINENLDFDDLLDFSKENNLLGDEVIKLFDTKISLEDILKIKKYEFLSDHIREEFLKEDLEKLTKIVSEPVEFNPSGINVSSIHKSKGLQADYVFILGVVEGIIPNSLKGLDTIEAQRRLLFVGMSRAKKRLYLVSTAEWDGKYVHRVDKNKFKFDPKSRKHLASSSIFISDLDL